MKIRKAAVEDIAALILMRWDFTLEHQPEVREEYEVFARECRSFLVQAMGSERWHIWVAEQDGIIASHIYIQLIDKVPRPERTAHPFAYMTNVYTLPDYRSQGIGSQLLKTIQEWSAANKYEFIIVWPSKDSREFYANNGYTLCNDPMELHL